MCRVIYQGTSKYQNVKVLNKSSPAVVYNCYRWADFLPLPFKNPRYGWSICNLDKLRCFLRPVLGLLSFGELGSYSLRYGKFFFNTFPHLFIEVTLQHFLVSADFIRCHIIRHRRRIRLTRSCIQI